LNPAAASVEGGHPAAELSLSLERDHDAPAVARAAIVGFCEGRGVDSTVVSTLMLLVSEVVTNAVIHPNTKRDAPIGFAARLRRDFIRVEVTDQGSGFTPRTRDPQQVGGGYGLFLLEKQSRRWGVSAAGGTTVWFEVDT
jgi:anti-sigma regulatory factor (Ser/Thr protein kinase)